MQKCLTTYTAHQQRSTRQSAHTPTAQTHFTLTLTHPSTPPSPRSPTLIYLRRYIFFLISLYFGFCFSSKKTHAWRFQSSVGLAPTLLFFLPRQRKDTQTSCGSAKVSPLHARHTLSFLLFVLFVVCTAFVIEQLPHGRFFVPHRGFSRARSLGASFGESESSKGTGRCRTTRRPQRRQ